MKENTGTHGDNRLNEMQIDAVGEIMNISMGSAATALSSMLDKQVLITTPEVRIADVESLDYSFLEPAMLVTITYEKGITGSNMMVFRQSDMQCILNTLMGIDEPPDDNYEFDEMGISAASEVMNQMMGASSTALSEFLGRRIYISIPTAVLMDEENTVEKAINMESGKEVVVILFDLTITDVMESQFIYIMEIDLAKMLVSQFMNDDDDDDDDANTVGINGDADVYLRGEQSSRSSSHAGGIQDTQPPYQQTPTNPPTPPYGYDYLSAPPANWWPMSPQPFGSPPYAAPPGYQYPYGYVPPNMHPHQQFDYPNGQGERQQMAGSAESSVLKNNVNVQNVQFPEFENSKPMFSAPLTTGNMDLLMNVPLSVSIEIGRTKKKIRDIMEFSQGTIIELEKQAGAPVDIIVNGQLMARGDVVVIDDNFAVRVTEIVGTKELISSLEEDSRDDDK